MNRKSKIILICLSVLFLILAIFVKVLGMYEKKEPAPVTLPPGNLSDSLFVLQNNTYIPQDGLPTKISFGKIPYSVDMVDSSYVSVGNGYVFSLTQGYMCYVSCIPKGDLCAVTLKEEYAKAVLINNIPEMANCSLLHDESGFLNGFNVTYSIYELGITDNVSVTYSYIVGYLLTLPESDYDLYLSVTTTSYNTDTLKNCKDILDMLVYTIQYDEKKASEIESTQSASPDLSQEADYDTQNNITDQQPSPTPFQSDLPEGAGTNEHLVVLKQDYSNLRIEISWSNAYTNVEMVLYDPTKTFYYSPVSCADGTALFYVGQVSAGNYYLEVTGADYGEVSMTLKDGE